MCLLGDYMPHAPLGILNVSLVAGYDVNMDMKYALPGRWPHIDADIVAIRFEFPVQQLALLVYQVHAGIDLLRRQVEKASDMSTRNDHSMPRAHRVGIAGTISKFILQ